jgi:signal transduction histidine kinase
VIGTAKHILERIETKKADYSRYGFSPLEDTAFKTFFDLAQEFDGMDDFYSLCVAIPKEFFGLEARLFVLEPEEKGRPSLVSQTNPDDKVSFDDVMPFDRPYQTDGGTLVLTIWGKSHQSSDDAIGLLEVYPAADIDSHSQLFLEKYANRIGFNLHNRFLVQKNIEHLNFIRSLVIDIEHNVIAPNMVYKLLLRNMKDMVVKNLQIEVLLGEYLSEDEHLKIEDLKHFQMELHEVNHGMKRELFAMERHYKNLSLFLETLLRRAHFDQGRLILRTKECNMKKSVVKPQLEQYLDRFARMGITIEDRLSGLPDEETVSVIDVGLMSQVYANLFSNALKYTHEVTSSSGEIMKYVSYGREVAKDFFGPGKDGIKYNVFTTGQHIRPDEHDRLFDEGYRASEFQSRPGSGHGLAFVKNVIEMHDGVIGYEPTQYGNNFYFILPK